MFHQFVADNGVSSLDSVQLQITRPYSLSLNRPNVGILPLHVFRFFLLATELLVMGSTPVEMSSAVVPYFTMRSPTKRGSLAT